MEMLQTTLIKNHFKTLLLAGIIHLLAIHSFAQNGNPPWKLGGNTISSGSFLGTTNSKDLVFKANGIEGMRLKANNRKLIIKGRSQFNLKSFFKADVEFQSSLTLKSLEDYLATKDRLIGVNNNGVIKVLTAATLLDLRITDSLILLGKVVANNGITFSDGTIQTSAASLTGCNNAIFAEVNIVNELKLGTNSLYLGSDNSGSDNYIYTDNGPLRINAQEGGNTLQNTYINQDGGRVGIGTASPSAKLSLNGNESPKTLGTSTECAIKINNEYANTFGANTEIQFGIAAGITAAVIAAKYTSSGNGKAGSDLIFGTQSTLPNEVGVIERMRITHDGNIGIGTTNPSAKLDVGGSANVSGNFEVAGLTAIGTTINDPIYGFRENAPNSNGGNWYKTILKGGLMVSGSSNGIFFRKGRTGETPTDQVNGSIAMCLEDRPNGDASFANGSTDPILGLNWFSPWPRPGGSIGGNWQMFISASAHNAGFVGLGTPYPKSRLNIAAKADEIVLAVTRTETNEDMFRVLGNGHVWANKLFVQTAPFPDYVFKPNYELMPLENLQDYIIKNHRLPHMPSAEDVAKDGIDVGELNRILVEKVEELTLYIIEQNRRIQKIENQ
jgi:hypothetical protein